MDDLSVDEQAREIMRRLEQHPDVDAGDVVLDDLKEIIDPEKPVPVNHSRVNEHIFGFEG